MAVVGTIKGSYNAMTLPDLHTAPIFTELISWRDLRDEYKYAREARY